MVDFHQIFKDLVRHFPCRAYDGLIYNNANNKLYALRIDSASGAIAEIALSGSSFICTPVAATIGYHTSVSPATSTLDRTTGDIYFAFTAITAAVPGGKYYIEKYHPGATASTLVTSGVGAHILGLRFNKNTHMLYAIREDAFHNFISIDPASGNTAY